MPFALYVLLVWFTVVCVIFLVSAVHTKCCLLCKDYCVSLIVCTYDSCASYGILVAQGGHSANDLGFYFSNFLAASTSVLKAFCLVLNAGAFVRAIVVGDVVGSQKVERRGKTVNDCR